MPGTNGLNTDGAGKAAQFRPMLVSHAASEPDFELFRYAAMIASIFGVEQTLVAVAPGRKDPGSLVTVARKAFDSPVSGRIAFRLLFEPDPATLFKAAEEEGAELVVAPSAVERWNGSVEQLAFESRYPVWFVPQRFGTRLLRAMARVELDAGGASLLHTATAACRAAGVQELVVAHLFSQTTLDQDAESIERLRQERILELYRFLARVDLHGMTCTPVVEESLQPANAAIRLARDHEPDIIFDSLSWPGIHTSWSRKEASRYLRNVGVPLLNVPCVRARPSGWRILKSRVFTEQEPAFG